MQKMYEAPSTQPLRDMFEKMYSAGEEGQRERADVARLLESVAVQAEDVLANLLVRIIYSSMKPLRAKTAEAAKLAAEAALSAGGSTPAHEPDAVEVADSDDEGEEGTASMDARSGDEDAADGGDEGDSSAKHAAFMESLLRRGLMPALEALLEHHATVAVDDVMRSIGFEAKFKAAGDDPEKLAAAVTESQTALLTKFADLPRRTFRRLVPRIGGKLQKDVLQLIAAFFDCVVSDVCISKAELGSVWKARAPAAGVDFSCAAPQCCAHTPCRHAQTTLEVVSKESGPATEAKRPQPNKALKAQLCKLEDKLTGAHIWPFAARGSC